MSIDPWQLRSERHVEIGSLIRQEAGIVIDRWCRRAVKEQPDAKRVHHETLRDHLITFLQELGRDLAESDDEENGRCRALASAHGEQRWETGWSLTEVVRDYQILRLVFLEYLEERLDRPLFSREVMALGLALDEAIAVSVNRYVRNQEEALRQHEENLKEANRRKDEFLALLGHELRNPLTPIRNALSILARQGSDPTTVEWARALMDRQVKHMTHLVEDLLDVARIARGKVVIRHERFDLVALVRATSEDRRGAMSEAGLTLTVDLPQEAIWVDGDPTLLVQVVGNLLHNALKFTDRGGEVTVRIARAENDQRAVVAIRDTGIGIEPNLVPHVFETYVQADRSVGRSQSGLGLGLALVKGLVELHGGQVRAASAGVGQGSEFSLWLPLSPRRAAPPEKSSAAPHSTQSLRLLIVEDNRDSADSLKKLLELSGHRVAVAYSGPAGLEAARRDKPDVVVCDLGLPGMDGYAVAAALRADPATAQVRLIAVSGHGSEADQRRCLEVGFALHLTKPIDLVELQQALESVTVDGN